MWARGNVPSHAVTPQQLFDKGLTDPKEGRDTALRAQVLITGPQDVLSEVEGVGSHARKSNAVVRKNGNSSVTSAPTSRERCGSLGLLHPTRAEGGL